MGEYIYNATLEEIYKEEKIELEHELDVICEQMKDLREIIEKNIEILKNKENIEMLIFLTNKLKYLEIKRNILLDIILSKTMQHLISISVKVATLEVKTLEGDPNEC